MWERRYGRRTVDAVGTGIWLARLDFSVAVLIPDVLICSPEQPVQGRIWEVFVGSTLFVAVGGYGQGSAGSWQELREESGPRRRCNWGLFWDPTTQTAVGDWPRRAPLQWHSGRHGSPPTQVKSPVITRSHSGVDYSLRWCKWLVCAAELSVKTVFWLPEWVNVQQRETIVVWGGTSYPKHPRLMPNNPFVLGNPVIMKRFLSLQIWVGENCPTILRSCLGNYIGTPIGEVSAGKHGPASFCSCQVNSFTKGKLITEINPVQIRFWWLLYRGEGAHVGDIWVARFLFYYYGKGWICLRNSPSLGVWGHFGWSSQVLMVV